MIKCHNSQLLSLIPAMNLIFSSTKVCLNSQEVPPLKHAFEQCRQAIVEKLYHSFGKGKKPL
jgi:hypothetical protein